MKASFRAVPAAALAALLAAAAGVPPALAAPVLLECVSDGGDPQHNVFYDVDPDTGLVSRRQSRHFTPHDTIRAAVTPATLSWHDPLSGAIISLNRATLQLTVDAHLWRCAVVPKKGI